MSIADLLSQLTAPCPSCTKARELYRAAWNAACCNRNVSLKGPEIAGDESRIDCDTCKNRGEVLTAEGRHLLRFIADWTRTLDPTKP